jgi:hypothetical protein
MSSSARGAKQTTHHGPLERLLEVTLTITTVRGRLERRKRRRQHPRVKRAHGGDQPRAFTQRADAVALRG